MPVHYALYSEKISVTVLLFRSRIVMDEEVSGTIPDHFVLRAPPGGSASVTGLSFAREFKGESVSVFMHFSKTSDITTNFKAKGNNCIM